VIPGAKVVLINEASKATRSVKSNGEGLFFFAAVQAASYDVEVSYNGFETWKVTGINVHPGDNLTVPRVNLQTGAVSESVTVTAEVAGVTTDSGEHSTLITSAQIQRLSTVGRDAAELISILPGFTFNATDASNGTPDYQTAGFGRGNLGSFGANGAAPQGGLINITSDGANVLDAGDMGGTITSVNMDQVQEVKVQTANFGADQARGPIVISAVGKSGSSEYHGSLYTYLRNYAANSNDWISNYFGTARPQQKYFYPGGSFGGPVTIPGTRFNHNKRLIFWAGFERYQQQTYAGLLKAFIPSSAMLGGDLSTTSLGAALHVSPTDLASNCTSASGISALYNNVGGLCYSPDGGKDTNDHQINKGIIPSVDIDPGVAAYSKWYPKPNRTPQPVTNSLGQTTAATDAINYVKNQMSTQNGYQFHTRVDQNFSDNLKLYGTYNLEYVNAISALGPSFFGYPGSNIPMPTNFDSDQIAHLLTLNLTKTLGTSLTNEAVISGVLTRSPGQFEDRSKMLDTGTSWAPYDGGVQPQVLYGAGTTQGKVGEHQIPAVGSWDGPMPSFGWGYVPTSGQYSHKFSWNAYDNVTKVLKTHSLKAGVYAEQTGDNEATLASNLAGSNFFMRWGGCFINQPLSNYPPAGKTPLPSPTVAGEPDTAGTGNEIGQFLIGCPAYSTQDTKDTSANLRYTSIEGYATDEWKVLRNLTLTLGLRLSHMGPWTDRHGVGLAVWDPSQLTKNVLLSGITQDPRTWPGIKWHQMDSSVPMAGVPTRPLFYAPRFSLAYDMYGDGKTVFRGGLGAYYSHDGLFYSGGAVSVPLGKQSWTSSSSGTSCTYSQLYGNTTTPVLPCGYYTQSTVSAQTAPFSLSAMDPHDDRQPLTYNYNFTLDQSLPLKMQFELAYVGNQSSNLSTLGSLQNQNVVPLGAYFGPDPAVGSANFGQVFPVNGILNSGSDYRPYPNYQSVNVPSHRAWANYNSMQAALNRQAGSFIFGVNYTWSKSLAVRGSWDNGSIADPENMNHDYGITSFDRRHVLNANYSWQEGTRFHGNKIVGGAVNGWEVSGILSVASGPDLSILNNYGTNFNLSSGGATYYVTSNGNSTSVNVPVNSSTWLGSGDYALQPTVRCDPSQGLNKSLHQYVNGSCFGLPAQGTEGVWNLPYIAGPMFFKWDMSVYKDIKISERQNMQFRLSGFNFLNHPLISFSGQDPSNPLTLQVGDSASSHYTSLQDALNGIQVMNTGTYAFGQTKFKTGQRILEAGFKYNF
jgi:hypothetical protein